MIDARKGRDTTVTLGIPSERPARLDFDHLTP
jgi:hypothetical protein